MSPDSLPLLRPGTHFSPDDGACLMELASVLAGERWSDHPSCTDPTLATIARVVNDELTSTSRQALTPMVGNLIGRTGDPARLAPLLVRACLAATQRLLPRPSRTLERHRRRAARRLAALRRPRPAWAARLAAWLYARGPAQQAITAMILAVRRLPSDERDRALLQVFAAALAATCPTPRRDWAERLQQPRTSQRTVGSGGPLNHTRMP
ncbi:hypothetical protein [Micromonospora aurantiaca (nom. illeg.)]|uniref:hypothetical protein n=1 Tax=Micromonospora aurantiaca (nom. illeg.) TaxID=47850 RepID=UPI00165764AD|nr:hypothetical protein [Micromonospora aurantiaca]MBC9001754.1 hypothetical protein [Micromonospora aurantiaca]